MAEERQKGGDAPGKRQALQLPGRVARECVRSTGGTVAVYSDISELKRRGESLSDQSAALAALSGKLAKYLAPQVYDPIFTARQDVRITGQRKKLTICFSDMAGFTETTDRMESAR
jgi:adenylate cyclase